jgi:hypothetical protein
MITSFEDFCLWTYVLIDDCWQQIAPMDRRPGPTPVCSDAELITMAIVGECKGWDEETVLLSEWAAHRDLFPHQPTRTRFNRRRRQLPGAINRLRRLLVAGLDFAHDRLCIVDRLPIPVIRFHLVPRGAIAYWESYAARFGKVPSKSITIFGYKRSLLVTGNGVILDFVLVPANVMELQAGVELVEEQTDWDILGDNAFISAPLQARLLAEHRLRLRTLPRRNQRVQLPKDEAHALNAARQVIETVNSQLAEQFGVEINHAQSFWGWTARLITKLTAHTLSVALNRLLGAATALQIKALAFPKPI